jgi:phage baseplate assembly protein W
MATINRNTRQFTDFNLLFTAHPSTKDVTLKTDEDAVKASIRNLISTNNFEKPFHPEIGCQIYGLLFENLNPLTVQIMKQTVIDVIDKFEPRAVILDVLINDNVDKNSIDVDVIFRLVNSEKPVSIKTAITRAR